MNIREMIGVVAADRRVGPNRLRSGEAPNQGDAVPRCIDMSLEGRRGIGHAPSDAGGARARTDATCLALFHRSRPGAVVSWQLDPTDDRQFDVALEVLHDSAFPEASIRPTLTGRNSLARDPAVSMQYAD
jgi:hypothetical protein